VNRHATTLLLGCALAALAARPAFAEPPPSGQPEPKPAEPSGAPALPAAPPPAAPPPGLVTIPPALPEAPPSAEASEPEPEAVPEASPPPEPRFGDAGQVVLDGVLGASFGHLGYSSGGTASTTFSVQPALDYFSSSGVSEGVSAFFRYADSSSAIYTSDRSFSYGVTGAVGSNLWLGKLVSLWPKLSLGVWQTRISLSSVYGGSTTVNGRAVAIGSSTEITENAVFVDLYVPFLFHLAPHFFVGIGPEGYTDILNSANGTSNKREFFGASSTVGGWF